VESGLTEEVADVGGIPRDEIVDACNSAPTLVDPSADVRSKEAGPPKDDGVFAGQFRNGVMHA
jgi:hypothetical protein